MFKMSEYSFVAGLLAVGLALVCYVLAIVLSRLGVRRSGLAAAGAGGGTVSLGGPSIGALLMSWLPSYGTLSGWVGFACLSAWLVFRTVAVGHGPFANMYEFSVSFAWGTLGAYLFFERRYHLRTIGLFVLPIVLAMLGYAAYLSATTSTADPLVPALQNNLLLTVHVAVAIIAYGSFSIAAVAGLLFLGPVAALMVVVASAGFLAVTTVLRVLGFIGAETWTTLAIGTTAVAVVAAVISLALYFIRGNGGRGLPRPEILDEISYRAVVVGFPFLTLVIVLGAVWAEVAWGTYWSWDPKETASLVTWLIYGAYLHARVVRGWRGGRSAVLLMLGFAATLFTYFGNLFFGGLHSYAGLG